MTILEKQKEKKKILRKTKERRVAKERNKFRTRCVWQLPSDRKTRQGKTIHGHGLYSWRNRGESSWQKALAHYTRKKTWWEDGEMRQRDEKQTSERLYELRHPLYVFRVLGHVRNVVRAVTLSNTGPGFFLMSGLFPAAYVVSSRQHGCWIKFAPALSRRFATIRQLAKD
jgi:hypothetical protein